MPCMAQLCNGKFHWDIPTGIRTPVRSTNWDATEVMAKLDSKPGFKHLLCTMNTH